MDFEEVLAKDLLVNQYIASNRNHLPRMNEMDDVMTDVAIITKLQHNEVTKKILITTQNGFEIEVDETQTVTRIKARR